MGVSQNQGYLFGGPYHKDYSIVGSILGSPYFGKLPSIFLVKTCLNQVEVIKYEVCSKGFCEGGNIGNTISSQEILSKNSPKHLNL